MNDVASVVDKIRKGELDCNNQELFFSGLLKGLMLSLNNTIQIRNKYIPHIIVHTGDDLMYLKQKGQNDSIEPYEVSNEDYIYNITPNCIITPNTVDVLSDQLTNPYSNGRLQYQTDDNVYTLQGEFRRIPLKFSVNLKYRVSTFRDSLELIQQIITKLTFIRTYNITYMGQFITCSYKIPESFQAEHLMELDGMTTDSKDRTLSLDLEIESNIPVYSHRSIMSTEHIIKIIPRDSVQVKCPEKSQNIEQIIK